MPKKILIITNYFPPETGAASNRIFHLAEGLQKLGHQIKVITPLPNYPTGKIFKDYQGKLFVKENFNGIDIVRLFLYASNSKNKLKRLLAMVSYSFSLLWYFLWHKIPSTVIVQSPPLLVAFTSMLFLKSRRRNLILNVSDLWPSAGLELGAFTKGRSYKLLQKIERFNYKSANLVLGQSQEILAHVKTICPNKEVFLYRNFPDFHINLNQSKPATSTIKLVYAGLLGIAQGVHKLCKELTYNNIEFHIYGKGAETHSIKTFIKENNHLPISYHGEVSRDLLHQELLQYDVAIIPLLHRIYGSVPSKIFEYARLGLPMVYFGGGEGEELIEKHGLGWVATAGDYKELNNVLQQLKKKELNIKLKNKIQQEAITSFDFNQQIQSLNTLL